MEGFGDVGRGEFDCRRDVTCHRRRKEGEFRQVFLKQLKQDSVVDSPIAFFPCPDLLLPYPGF